MPSKPFWRKRNEIRRVKISNGSRGPVRIGGHFYGHVYVGRIFFKDGKSKRVAIKVFRAKIPAEKAALYQKAIKDLAAAGVRIPKMSIAKMPTERSPEGEWVLVSQLFGSSRRGSKIENKSWLSLNTWKGKLEAVDELTKVASAGYCPASDLLEPFKEESKGVIVFDLDEVIGSRRSRKASAQARANVLAASISTITAHDSPKVKQVLFEKAMKAASPEIRAFLREHGA